MLITSLSLLACTNFLWWLNLEILTWVRGQTLPNSQIFLVLFQKLVFTQVKTSSLVLNQGIIHGNTVKGSNWDAWVILEWCPGVFAILAQHCYFPSFFTQTWFTRFGVQTWTCEPPSFNIYILYWNQIPSLLIEFHP